jgi:hypothetical protein
VYAPGLEGVEEYEEYGEMKRLFWGCFGLALGVLAGGHPMLADASEPVWLTEEEMDGVTAGTAFVSLQSIAVSALGPLQSVIVADTWTQTVETILPDGGTAVTSTTISCNSSCTASITSVNLANGTSSTVVVPLQ